LHESDYITNLFFSRNLFSLGLFLIIRQLHLLLALSLVLTLALVSLPRWASWFSRQNPIDPNLLFQDFNPLASVAIFNNQPVPVPPSNPAVLGDTTVLPNGNSASKRIEVDLTVQRLYAYVNNHLVYNYLISSGKWDRTPQGTFFIWTKIRSHKMEGGSKELGTYYYLPNVPYILFFYNDQIAKNLGFSIHGTYWHNNFGHPMSHGCINMRTSEAAVIYNWAEINTPVTIYGKYPSPLSSK
jgi:lipoprotein-anchoring transpeptidase ErfK/SrfK